MMDIKRKDKEDSKDKKYGHMHLHTPYSDGLIMPQDIIDAKLDFVAITDHDCVNGIKRYAKELEKHNISVIPGIELTVHHLGKDMHILAYFPSDDKRFLNEVRLAAHRRSQIAKKSVPILRNIGFVIDDTLFEKEAVITRGNICDEVFSHKRNINYLKHLGINTKKEFRLQYLEEGKVAYVSQERTPFEKYNAYCGGIKILAHPEEDLEIEKDDFIIEDLVKNFGLLGIETYSRKNSDKAREHYKKLAERLNIISIVSGDCHKKEDLSENQEEISTLKKLLERCKKEV